MTAKRFIVDDAGTLIDMETRDTYDYVSDVCGLLNELHEENEQLRKEIEEKEEVIKFYHRFNRGVNDDL